MYYLKYYFLCLVPPVRSTLLRIKSVTGIYSNRKHCLMHLPKSSLFIDVLLCACDRTV